CPAASHMWKVRFDHPPMMRSNRNGGRTSAVTPAIHWATAAASTPAGAPSVAAGAPPTPGTAPPTPSRPRPADAPESPPASPIGRPDAGAQLVLADLARRGLRQRTQVYLRRGLEVGGMRPDMRDDVLRIEIVGVRPRGHEGHGHLAPALVGPGDDRR